MPINRFRFLGYFSGAILIFLSLVNVVSATDCSLHGVPQSSYPNYQERGLLTLTNAVRISPIPFRNYYIPTAPNILNAYPAQPPLQWNYDLNRSARFYATDHANTPGCLFTHNSCDGTGLGARIQSFYTAPAYYFLENAAQNFPDPLSAEIAFLVDNFGSGPSLDHQGDGHRSNIMDPGVTETGGGYASGNNGRYFAEDFAAPVTPPVVCSPIAAAAHFVGTTDISFLVPYYSQTNQAPQSANIVLNGTTFPMTLHLGTAARGTYRYATSQSNTCRSYHFEFRDNTGALVRYPVVGEFRTFNEGTYPNYCSENFVGATPPACPADFNHDGIVSVQDIFAFLQAWFAGNPSADFNHTGGVSVQDIFDFLRAWFAGCP